MASKRRRVLQIAGATDPHLREMTIGVGCALENLLIAAAHDGYATTVAFLPDPGNPAHAAQVSALGADLPDVRVLWFSTPEQRKRRRDAYPRRPVLATHALMGDHSDRTPISFALLCVFFLAPLRLCG